LYYFLTNHAKGSRVLVFVNSIDSVRRLVSVLRELKVKAFALHSNMQQRQRIKSMDRFAGDRSLLESHLGKDLVLPGDTGSQSIVLVATDVAARGLDIPEIDYVVHYHMARTPDVYIHRSGRSGRAGRPGFVLAIVAPQEIMDYKRVSKSLGEGQGIQLFPVENSAFRACAQRASLAQQIEKACFSVSKSKKEESWVSSTADALGVDPDDFHLSKKFAGKKARSRDDAEDLAAEKHSRVKRLNGVAHQLRAQLGHLLNQGTEDARQVGLSRNFVTVNPTLIPSLVLRGPSLSSDSTTVSARMALDTSRAKRGVTRKMRKAGRSMRR
jgi:ATP-dependent RNA helicase DDX24/MAK5